MTQEPEERQEISQKEVDRYTESKYKVITVIPYTEKTVTNTYILSQEALDELLEHYMVYAEFVVEISIQEEGTT